MTPRPPARRNRPSLRGRAASTLAAVVCVACGADTAGPDGLDVVLVRAVFTPPMEYYAWWDEIRTCSGETGSLSDVRFFRAVEPLYVDGAQFPCGDGELCNGLWEAPHDITLAPAYLDTPRLVKHEMLHDLLGVPGHPAVFEECGVSWGVGSSFDILPE